jgi:hypothetical protein
VILIYASPFEISMPLDGKITKYLTDGIGHYN